MYRRFDQKSPVFFSKMTKAFVLDKNIYIYIQISVN